MSEVSVYTKITLGTLGMKSGDLPKQLYTSENVSQYDKNALVILRTTLVRCTNVQLAKP